MGRIFTPFRLALWGMVLIAVLAVGWTKILSPRLNNGIADSLGQGDYRLVTTAGETFTEKSLRGGPSAVFFGFTHCPEVCPTTLGDIAVWQEELGDLAKDLSIYFITVDPERDTAELLRDYVGWVDNAQGVTGSRAEIDKAIRAFRIYARKVPLDDGDYTMDHSAYVLLFDEDGRMFEPVAYQEPFERVVAKLRRLLG